eukprot:CAMPEP_0118655204 /NCGR_PEP_ID=MMETSP0785-20121206/12798_1 /TAXON_ID=91992 /ORGANISM="Bolidomonas pacifica, Strain CCMP 1866" /LENGTH=316 /DNA_ID=CAMNT_0006547915 /DNA_START=71 /DNA_END=1017 /DNA_ORIENTATION=-
MTGHSFVLLPQPAMLRTRILAAKPKKPNTPKVNNEKLKEKLNVKRDPLGHVIPLEQKKVMRNQRRNASSGKVGGRSLGVMAQGSSRSAGISNVSRLKILSGLHLHRPITSPNVYLRPMMGKVKEALFSQLQSIGIYDSGPMKHLDLFAGSGNVGLENLSRGVKITGGGSTTFVDLAQDCIDTINVNLEDFDFVENGKAVKADVMDALQRPEAYSIETVDDNDGRGGFDLVTVTPPYEEVVYGDIMNAICTSKAVKQDTIVVIEYPVELGTMPHVVKAESGEGRTLVGVRNRKYGRTVIGIYIADPTGKYAGAVSRP